MKAISLPSNVMVYLGITLIIVIAVVIFMLLNGPPNEDYYFLMKKGCLELIKDCNKAPSTIMIENKKLYTLEELCNLNNVKPENCAKSCGC